MGEFVAHKSMRKVSLKVKGCKRMYSSRKYIDRYGEINLCLVGDNLTIK